MHDIRLLFSSLSYRDKRRLIVLTGLSIIVSLFETVGVASIMLFISIATNFDMLRVNTYCAAAYRFSGATSPLQFVIGSGIILLIFYVARTLLGIWHLYMINHFSQMMYASFSRSFFDQYLAFRFQDFTTKNSADIAHVLFNCSGNVVHVFSSVLIIASEGLTIGCIYLMLLLSHFKMTLGLTVFLGGELWCTAKILSQYITSAGKRCQNGESLALRVFNETVGNFKLIKLFSSQQGTKQKFSATVDRIAQAKTLYTTTQGLPRFLFEGSGFVLLVSMVLVVLYFARDAHLVMPIVALYALSFYRLLPSINKMLASYNQLVFSRPALQKVFAYQKIERERSGVEPITFASSIIVAGLSFGYPGGKEILHDITLEIKKGQRVAFIGGSGAGKSTLLDIIMGLYQPSLGKVVIDGVSLSHSTTKAWFSKIGYIPQSIYLFDGTVADNVVFGRSYDEQKLIQVLCMAKMYDFLCEGKGLATWVGEGGVALSGGQRQRIAIARALYGDPELLILDEATAGLDHENETKIMDELYNLSLDITLIMVTHRIAATQRCDAVYILEQGRISLKQVPMLSASNCQQLSQ
ncbi:MAG: ABC transporter ATP-binding protein [Candidatus Babeliales bacterium]